MNYMDSWEKPRGKDRLGGPLYIVQILDTNCKGPVRLFPILADYTK